MALVTPGSPASRVGRIAGLAALSLLQAYWFLQPLPFAARGFAAIFLLLSIARPSYGLLVFAGLSPLSTALAGLCGGGAVLGGQMLEQMALSIGAGSLARGGPQETRTRIGAPGLFMSVVAVASAMSVFPAAAAPTASGFGGLLQQLDLRHMVPSSPGWAPLFAALVIVECGLLAWATERTVRSAPPLATQLVRMALIGHAGAGMLNFSALLAGAARTGDALEALPQLLLGVRLSTQSDVHAAASSLLLACIAGLGLMSGPRASAVVAGALVALVATGLWITGSRVAILVGLVTGLAAIGWLVSRKLRRRLFALGGIAVLVLGAAFLLTLYLSQPAGVRNSPVSRSANARIILAQAGIGMFEETPAFGIGIARFYPESARFLEGRLGENYHENAHNNFIQVLAEQGLVGFGALLWCLGVVVIGGARAQFAQPTALRACLLAAVVACTATWMTGHPLLVQQFAFVFWFYCGVLAAVTPGMSGKEPRWMVWLLTAGVLLSVPPRATAVWNAIDLEHQGIGLSMWQHDDAERYRVGGASFALFLPATGRPVAVPLRRAPDSPDPLLVDVTISGRLMDRVSVAGEAWQTIVVLVPQGSRRFERVDFDVRSSLSAGEMTRDLLRVGKQVAR